MILGAVLEEGVAVTMRAKAKRNLGKSVQTLRLCHA